MNDATTHVKIPVQLMTSIRRTFNLDDTISNTQAIKMLIYASTSTPQFIDRSLDPKQYSIPAMKSMQQRMFSDLSVYYDSVATDLAEIKDKISERDQRQEINRLAGDLQTMAYMMSYLFSEQLPGDITYDNIQTALSTERSKTGRELSPKVILAMRRAKETQRKQEFGAKARENYQKRTID